MYRAPGAPFWQSVIWRCHPDPIQMMMMFMVFTIVQRLTKVMKKKG